MFATRSLWQPVPEEEETPLMGFSALPMVYGPAPSTPRQFLRLLRRQRRRFSKSVREVGSGSGSKYRSRPT